MQSNASVQTVIRQAVNRGTPVRSAPRARAAIAPSLLVRSLQALLTAIGGLAILSALSLLLVPTAAYAADRHASPTLTFASHQEKAGAVRLIAGSYLAAHRGDERYVAIPVAVSIRAGGPKFTVRPETFTLITASGDEIPAATFTEIRNNYRRQRFDARLLSIRPFLGGQEFIGMIGVPSNFYPPPDGGVRLADAQLAGNTFVVDLLYFEVPDGGLDGVFQLRLDADGLGQPIEVGLELP